MRQFNFPITSIQQDPNSQDRFKYVQMTARDWVRAAWDAQEEYNKFISEWLGRHPRVKGN